MRTLIATIAALAVCGNAVAATYGGKETPVSEAFAARLAGVCKSSTLVLTDAAKAACASGSFPRLTAAATAFINSGTGGELNTLMRQFPEAVTTIRTSAGR